MNLFRILCLAALFVATSLAGAAPVTIVNKSLASEKIDAATLKSVLLGKKVSWDSGGRVMLGVLKTGSVAEDYLSKTVEMSVSAFNNYWRRLSMTGGGSAPKAFESEEELRKFVASTPGAIGFVDSASADASVATLQVP